MKNKILFVLHLPPPVHGAAMVGCYIKESSKINTEFECHYINLSTSSDLESIGVNSFKKYISLLGIVTQVIKALLKNKYKFCYMTPSARMPAFYKDVVIIFILKLFGVKLVYHFHNKGVAESSNSKLNKTLFGYAFKNAKVILLSKLLYPDIANYVSLNDVFICPNGIPPVPVLNNDLTSKHKPANKNCKLLFVSNMIIAKGPYEILDACKILIEKGVSVECHFVGDWFEITPSAFNTEVEKRGLENSVYSYGKKYGDEKAKFFMDADIFVFPTCYKNETFGLVNLEAMQYALPVISTNIGGIPDVVADEETGYLVACKNPQKLAEKLEILINNPVLRAEMGEAGRKRYQELFTLKAFEKNISDIFSQVCNN